MRLRWGGLVLLAGLLLAGCGGGGGSGPVASSSAALPAATTTAVSLDSTVPAAAASAVTQVVTPIGSGALNTSVPVPVVAAGSQTLVLATNANGDILLAALLGSSNSTSLSATSTALALTRLAIGSIPAGMTADQLDTAIQGTTEFPNLVNLITQALTAGQAPSTSSVVLTSINTVVTQTVSSLTAAAPTAATALKLSSPTLSAGSVPYLIGSGVYLTGPDSQSSGGVHLKNLFPVYWTISTYNAEANTTDMGPQIATGTLDGNSLSLANLATSLLVNGTTANADIAGNSSEFNLVVAQDAASHRQNALSLEQNTLLLVLELGNVPDSIDACVPAAASAALALEWPAIEADTSAAGLVKVFQSTASPDSLQAIGSALQQCLPSAASATISQFLQAEFIQGVKKYLTGFGAIVDAYDTGALLTQYGKVILDWNDSHTLGVCENASILVDCATQIQATPTTVSLSPGQSATVTLAPTNASGFGTEVQNYIWQSSNPAVATATTTGNDQGTIQALANGTTTITAMDPGTGVVSNAVTVTVSCTSCLTIAPPASAASQSVLMYQPAIVAEPYATPPIAGQPPQIALKTGQTYQLSATAQDLSGNPVALPTDLVWASTDPSIATVDPATGLLTGVGTGGTLITVADPASGNVSAPLQVYSGVGVTITSSVCGTMTVGSITLQTVSISGTATGSINATFTLGAPVNWTDGLTPFTVQSGSCGNWNPSWFNYTFPSCFSQNTGLSTTKFNFLISSPATYTTITINGSGPLAWWFYHDGYYGNVQLDPYYPENIPENYFSETGTSQCK